MKHFAWLKTSRLPWKVAQYFSQAVKTGLKSNPFMATGLYKSIVMESVYSKALVVLVFIKIGS